MLFILVQLGIMMKVLTYTVAVLLLLLCACREDAERAIRTLNGYGYDNLILHVEWAAPRAERS
jgi:hypothetical protein